MKLTPISELIKQYGSQKKMATNCNVAQNQICRWNQSGALVNLETGDVYTPSCKKLEFKQQHGL